VSPPARAELGELRLTAKDVTWPARGATAIQLQAGLGGGSASAEGRLGPDARSLDLKVALRDVDLAVTRGYLAGRGTVAGKAGGDFDVRLSLQPFVFTARGAASISDLSVSDGTQALVPVPRVEATGLAYVWLRPKNMAYLPRFREVDGVIRFGGGALLANLVRAANDAIPDVVLGKLGSARQVGLVSRANSTVHMFLYIAGSAMTFGSQTYLAQAHHARRSLEPLLHRAIALVTGVGWPMLAVTVVAAPDVIVGLYGPKWIEAAPAVAPLALMTAIELMFYYSTNAFNAIGRPALASIPLLVTTLARILLGVALFSGSMVSFAWSLMLATLATAPVWLLLHRRYLDCGILRFGRMLLPGALVSLVCTLAAWGTLVLLDRLGIMAPMLRLAILAGPTGLAWLAALRLLDHPVYEELQIVMKKVWPRPRWAPAAEAAE